MTKILIQSKPIQLTAERFYPEKKPWPEGVIDLSNEVVQQGWGVRYDDGFYVLNPGDWVVTGIFGKQFVVEDEEIRRTYDWILRDVDFPKFSGKVYWRGPRGYWTFDDSDKVTFYFQSVSVLDDDAPFGGTGERGWDVFFSVERRRGIYQPTSGLFIGATYEVAG